MPTIAKINAHKVLNSRGDWTIQSELTLTDGSFGEGTVPEGASKGGREAVSLGVEQAVDIANDQLEPILVGKDFSSLKSFDTNLIELDGTSDKAKLGENTMLSLSVAFARACSESLELPLYKYLHHEFKTNRLGIPTPVFNVINGGKHANNGLSFQEFMIIPARRLAYDKALDIGVKGYHSLKAKLMERGFEVEVGDEGGFAPEGLTSLLCFDFITEAMGVSGFNLGDDVFLGMDVAANSFFDNGVYSIPEEKLKLSSKGLLGYFKPILEKYPIVYVEDPFMENDLATWSEFNEKFGESLMVVGDDLVATNTKRLESLVNKKCHNAVIIKPNQIGTLSETYNFVKKAKEFGMYTIVSHRSGESVEDTFIADFAVAVDADYFKAGAPAHERVAKYNRLLEISSELKTEVG